MFRRTTGLLLTFLLLALSLRAQTAPEPLRVMTYNIHHGEGLDQKLDLERIARLILDAKADIVALQEVDRGCERTQKRDLPAELSKLTGMNVHFEMNLPYQGGEYGNAVLTRFPIKSARNTHFEMLQPGEQRGVQQLVLDVHGRDVLFLNTHLDYKPNEAERALNVGELKRIVAAAGNMPVFLCGDLNAVPGSRTIESIATFLTDAWPVGGEGPGFTVPVRKPSRRIDYIWVSQGITPLRLQVLHSEASDHLPVVGTFRLNEKS